MEEQENDQPKRKDPILDMAKKVRQANALKRIIKGATMAMGVIVIVFMTFANIGPVEQFDFFKWITTALIMVGIIVFGMMMGESTGKDRQRNAPDGIFRKNLGLYNAVRQELREGGKDVYFPQFYVTFKERELKDKKIETLDETIENHALCERIIDGINSDDLQYLVPGSKVYAKRLEDGTEIKIRKLTKREYDAVKSVVEDGVDFHAPKNAYFLTAFGESDNTSILEAKAAINKQISANTWFTRAWRIGFSIAISFMWAFLTVKDFSEAGTTKAWANLISRLFSVMSGFLSGFSAGIIDTRLRAELLLNKYDVLSIFKTHLEKKIFVPKSYEEEVEEELKEDERKEKEAIDSVVAPILIGNEREP